MDPYDALKRPLSLVAELCCVQGMLQLHRHRPIMLHRDLVSLGS